MSISVSIVERIWGKRNIFLFQKDEDGSYLCSGLLNNKLIYFCKYDQALQWALDVGYVVNQQTTNSVITEI